jgi:hypothetical protein
MLFICVQIVGEIGKSQRINLDSGGDMDFKKIPINQSSYIRLYEDDTFEVHCSAQGPLGANVYYFKRGLLEWKQRRSYSFVSKKYKVTYE